MAEQAHLDEADAQNDTGFGASLPSQQVALGPQGWFPPRAECFAEAVEMLKSPHWFHSPASRHELHVPPSQRCHHCPICEDQCKHFLFPMGLAILLVDFQLAFAASVEDGFVAVP